MLNVLDEFTHECLAIRVARELKAIDVIDVLSELFILRGVPAHIRSDNGPEFVAQVVQDWISSVGAKTAYIDRGSCIRGSGCAHEHQPYVECWTRGYVQYWIRKICRADPHLGGARQAGSL